MALPLITYAPDADPTAPGVLVDAEHVVPSTRGLKSAPSAAATLLPALGSECVGGATLVRLDSQVRLFAATADTLYEGGTSAWTDVSDGGGYTAATERWRFAQFGNVSLATSKENVVQESTSGAFAPISGAPAASIIETVGQFVMLADTDDGGSYGDRPDSWWCSALGDYTDWTPALATQCATGRLTSVPGKITALRRFGDGVFVGKERGCYIGSYTGVPFIWSFQELPADSGPVGQEACILIGTPEQPKLFYVARDNFYIFAGDRPVPVGEGVKQFFLSRVNSGAMGKIMCAHDRANSLVYIYYPTGGSSTCTAGLVYNYRQNRWGVSNRTVEFVVDYQGSAVTYDDIATLYPTTTYDNLPSVPYDQLFATLAGVGVPAIFDAAHTLKVLNGAAENSVMITGDFGSDMQYSLLKRVKPTWFTKPTRATVTPYCRPSLGETLEQGPQASMNESRFDFLVSARWHRLRIETQGAWEASRFETVLTPQGAE
jgi:hypothetical protein